MAETMQGDETMHADETMRVLDLRVGEHGYRALVGANLLERAGEALAEAGVPGRLRVVADEVAWRLHGGRLMAGLEGSHRRVDSTTLPFREESKNLETVSRVYDWLLDVGVERGDTVVAFGGGVCGDLVGFAAATILRGISFVQVPTTLLAQVDASIGGKTGVNHPRGKNLIGAFYQPSVVLADTSVLASLPKRELLAGWAEVVKMAMVLDGALFAQLEERVEDLLKLEPALTTHAIARSIQLKGEVVARDERESDLRMVLNYGHTIGHALEQATGYATYLHGEAVAVGMAGAGLLAERLGLLAPEDLRRQNGLLEALELPTSCPGMDVGVLCEPMARDKKAREQRLTWVLPTGVGSYAVRSNVPASMVEEVLRKLSDPTDPSRVHL